VSKRIGLLTALVLLAFPALAGAKIVLNQSIAGIKLGEAKQTVRKQLGPPGQVIAPSSANQNQTQWVYKTRKLLVGFQKGHVVQVFTMNRSQKTAGGIGVGSTKAAVLSHIKGVQCQHVPGFTGQECITAVRRGAKEWTTDFHINNGHVSSVLVNIFSGTGGALDRALSAHL
jgi:hypothetical protein